MKLTFMIYLVVTAVVSISLSKWATHLDDIGNTDNANLFGWLSIFTLLIGSLLTIRRATIDEVIKN